MTYESQEEYEHFEGAAEQSVPQEEPILTKEECDYCGLSLNLHHHLSCRAAKLIDKTEEIDLKDVVLTKEEHKEIETWELKLADWDSEEAKKLLNEGWEPISVRKGDYVAWGWSWGWFFATPEICFRKKVKRMPYVTKDQEKE